MKPFDYQAPTTISEAVSLLADKGERARIYAGGTDLLVQLRLNRLDLDLIVDVKRIPELTCLSFDPVRGLTIGAAVSCAQICEEPDVDKLYPGLIDATSIIGGIGIREQATLGGNLCNASPSGDTIPAMIVLGARCKIIGPQGTRTIPVEEFCTGPGETVLEKDEILVSIHFPGPKPNSGAYYLRFTPRFEMDIAVVGAGAWVLLNDDQTQILDARIALAAVAPTPLLVKEAGDLLISQTPAEALFVEAAKLAQEAARPITDVRGTAAQRRHLVGVLVKRALRGAVARAKGEPDS